MRILLFLLFTAAVIPAAEDDLFALDQSLLAVWRVPSLQQTDTKLKQTLQTINPFYTAPTPLLSVFAAGIYNEKLSSVKIDDWAEAVWFALPLEKDNDWVYIYNITDERKYVADLLGLGNMRQEGQERGLTRYRRTNGEERAVFYLGFINEDTRRLAILSNNLPAAERARNLYLSRLTNRSFTPARADVVFAWHAARFYLTNTQFLPQFFNVLRQDLIVDLAGVTAKPDLAPVIVLSQWLSSVQRLVRELAIITLDLNLSPTTTTVSGSTLLQYGGSLHYAMTAAKTANNSQNWWQTCLPEKTEFVGNTLLWNELSGQILNGFASALTAFFPTDEIAKAAASAQKFYDDFLEADLRAVAWGVIDESEKNSGPVIISLLQWGKPEKLATLWQDGVALAQTSSAAEFLAERGIKLEIIADPTSEKLLDRWEIQRVQTILSVQNFTLPGILGDQQRYLAATVNDLLVIVAPSAPLDFDQYRVAEKYLLRVLADTLTALTDKAANKFGAAVAAITHNQADNFAQFAGNPLKIIQLALQSQAIWPQAGAPDSLPIPWTTYYEEFKNFPAVAAPSTLALGATRNQLNFKFIVANAALAELAGALLNCQPPTAPEKND